MASSSRTVVKRSTRSFRCSARAGSARSAGVRVRTSATSSSVSLPTRSAMSRMTAASSMVYVSCTDASPSRRTFCPQRSNNIDAMVSLHGCCPSGSWGASWVQVVQDRLVAWGLVPGRPRAPWPRSAFGFLAPVEHPLEGEVLSLGVTHDALAVPAELGIVRGQQDEPGEDPLAELVDHLGRAVVRLHLPVRGDGPQVDHAHVPDWLDRLTFFNDFFLGVRGHG